MSFTKIFLIFLFSIAGMSLSYIPAHSADAKSPSKDNRAQNSTEIDISAFRDSINHWRKIKEPERVMQPLPNQPSYAPHQSKEIADNILLFQRANGGWPKDYDVCAILTSDQISALKKSVGANDTTFDNRTTFSQVQYLARAYTVHKDERYRTAALRGLAFIYAAQYNNGGFPQKWPNPKSYHAHITYNDGAMTGIMNLLKDISERKAEWEWLDADKRAHAEKSFIRGISCLLKTQIHDKDTPTGWCQQHDEKTFEPRSARNFEPASICPQETTEIVRVLMRIENPDKDITHSINQAMIWLDKVSLKGIRIKKITAQKVEYDRHSSETDLVVEKDSSAPTIWARHYEIGSNKPIFANRDKKIVYALADVDRERRTGSAWYGYWPRTLIEKEYPAWKKKHLKNN